MKKIITVFLIIIICLTLLPINSLNSIADNKGISSNELEFITNEINYRNYNNSIHSKIEVLYNNIEKSNISRTSIDRYAEKYIEEYINNGKKNSEVTINNSTLLYNFNDKPEYLLVTFDQGGYAIMNRNSRLIYERTISGSNPYNNYIDKYKCYYGGPMNYIYKIKDNYNNIFNNNAIDIDNIKSNIKRIDQNHIDSLSGHANLKDTYNTRSSGYDSVGGHYLSEGNSSGDPWMDFARAIYFILIDGENCSYQWHTLTRTNPFSFNIDYIMPQSTHISLVRGSRFHFMKFYEGEPQEYIDAIIPVNRFGSCSMVAATMILQYYNRMEVNNTIPTNRNHWTTFNTYFNGSSLYSPYVNNPLLTESEQLHQYLIRLSRPDIQLNDDFFLTDDPVCSYNCQHCSPTPRQQLGTHGTAIKTGIESYFANNSSIDSASVVVNTNVNTNAKRRALAKQIYDGNPVWVNIIGDYEVNGNVNSVGSHAVVAYSYSMKQVWWWKEVEEFTVHFGWITDGYGSVIIAPSVVKNSLYIDYQ